MSAPARRDSVTLVMPPGEMARLAAAGQRRVRCPACVHPCIAASEQDESCGECDGARTVTADQADEWILRNIVEGP